MYACVIHPNLLIELMFSIFIELNSFNYTVANAGAASTITYYEQYAIYNIQILLLNFQ